MFPESLNERIYTYASDFWPLGITVMECVLGRFPFVKPQSYFDIVNATQSDPAFFIQNDGISKNCLDFIRHCLRSDMAERPTARDMLDHEWMRPRKDDANVLREWLDTTSKLHCEEVEIGSELAFNVWAKQREILRAKAQTFMKMVSPVLPRGNSSVRRARALHIDLNPLCRCYSYLRASVLISLCANFEGWCLLTVGQ